MIQRIDRRFYPDYKDNWDDQLFRERILEVIGPKTRLLDLGAGAGIVQAMNFRGLVQQVCGVDLDPRIQENPYLDEGGSRTRLGYPIPMPVSMSWSPIT